MSMLLIYKGVPDQIEVGDSNNTGEFRVGDVVKLTEDVCVFSNVLVAAGYICQIKRVVRDLCVIDDGTGRHVWVFARKLQLIYREEDR